MVIRPPNSVVLVLDHITHPQFSGWIKSDFQVWAFDYEVLKTRGLWVVTQCKHHQLDPVSYFISLLCSLFLSSMATIHLSLSSSSLLCMHHLFLHVSVWAVNHLQSKDAWPQSVHFTPVLLSSLLLVHYSQLLGFIFINKCNESVIE